MNYRLNTQASMILDTAKQEARDMGNNYIGSEHLLLAILKDTSTLLSHVLCDQGIYYYQLKEDLMILFGLRDQEVVEIQITQVVEDILQRALLLLDDQLELNVSVDLLTIALLQSKSCVALEILHRYDLEEKELLMQFHLEDVCELDTYQELRNLNQCRDNQDIVGRDEELNFMISILSRKDKANPLLIGEPGVGKTALVEKLASMIEKKEVPSLADSIIYELHLNSLVAGTKYRGDFEEKLQNIIQLLKKYPNVILFIDEIHMMIGAGKSEGSIDVSSVLKPYLARGSIRCIGSTTIEEYETYIEKDRALERRFQIVMIKEPDISSAVEMLKAKKKDYEDFHHVQIEDSIFDQIVKYCDYYIPQRRFPDKAIDVLDLACVYAKQRKIKKVDIACVQKVMETLTNIPLSTHNKLSYIKTDLYQNIVSHKKVIDKLMAQLEWIKQGIIRNRPLGVWLFLGSSGVGKQTLLNSFHKLYFNAEEMIELDLTYGKQNLDYNLSKIRRNPYTIVHVKNLHMANIEILQFLKQGIERGYFERESQKIDLRHSIIVMSGDFPYLKNSSLKFQEKMDPLASIKRYLDDDFVSIFDEVFVFQDLTSQDKVCIIQKMLKEWEISIEEKTILEAVENSNTIEEATKKLKGKIVKA